MAGLGKLRGDNDANCTYEGDNTVLLQQTSQWLLGLTRNGTVESPMGSVGWLGNLINNSSGEDLGLTNSWAEGKMSLDLKNPESALTALRLLVWRLLRATELEVMRVLKKKTTDRSTTVQYKLESQQLLSNFFRQLH